MRMHYGISLIGNMVFVVSVLKSIEWTQFIKKKFREQLRRTVPSSNLLFQCGLIVVFHKSTFYHIFSWNMTNIQVLCDFGIKKRI